MTQLYSGPCAKSRAFHTNTPGGDSAGGTLAILSRRSILLLSAALLGLAWLAWQAAERSPTFDFPLLLQTLRQLHAGWLAAAALLSVATYLGRTLRWAVFLEPLRPRVDFPALLSATLIGFTAVVLFGRPGEFVRPYLIAKTQDVPISSQAAAWLLERVFDLLMALSLFGFALASLDRSTLRAGPALRWALEQGGTVILVATMAGLLVLVALAFAPALLRSLAARLSNRRQHHVFHRLDRTLQAFVAGVQSLRNPYRVLRVLGWSVFEWILIALCNLCIMKAFGDLYRFGWIDMLIFLGFVTFGSVIQLPGIGGGMQVVAILVLREFFGLPVESATVVAMVIWFTTIIVIIPPGLVLALREGWNWGRLRRMSVAAQEEVG